jgi:hypothetical protein
MSEREDWINLVHNEYHPRPSFYSGFEWNDGTGRIADAILADKVLALREAADRIEALEAALREIARGEGRFSRDPYEHACNTIEDLIAIARAALAPEQDAP